MTTSAELRVVIAGGGTGGHLYPGIAVARELLAAVPNAQVTFAGTATGIEARVLPREGLALDVIRSAGLKGKSIGAATRGLALLPLSAMDSWRIVTRRQPSVVIGVGGYSSGPVVLLAALRGVPTLLMEQNAVPGLTNRLLARFVSAAAVTYEATRPFFGSKAFVSGNPVRSEFLQPAVLSEESETHDRTSGVGILVFGGSQGAHAINMAMVEAAPKLASSGVRFRLTHQTGARDVELVRSAYRTAGLEVEVEAFLYDMGRRLMQADVVVCRAGATTLAELTALGKAAILVPLPTAANDEQRGNARVMVAQAAAVMVEQRELSGDRIAAEILTLAGDRPRRLRIEAAARNLARPDAAKVIVEKVLALAR